MGSGEFANEKTYLADFKDFVFIEKPARRNDKKCQIQGHFYYKNFLKNVSQLFFKVVEKHFLWLILVANCTIAI